MNPCDAMPKDFQMYYDNCWMVHTTLGVGRVRVIDGEMHMELLQGKKQSAAVNAKYLSCWWPRPGAFNLEDSAVYIARRAIRNMRKSAMCGDHYFIKWGTPYQKDAMLLLRDGPNAIPLPEAVDLLKHKKYSSVAVTRDIIIHPEDDPNTNCFTVIFRGMETGRLVNGQYEPLFSGSPVTGRILRQLERGL
jgi:hypothetical protein